MLGVKTLHLCVFPWLVVATYAKSMSHSSPASLLDLLRFDVQQSSGMHSRPAVVGCVGMLLNIRKCISASLPPNLLGMILNAICNFKKACSLSLSLLGLLCFGLLSALTLRAHLRCDNFCDAKICSDALQCSDRHLSPAVVGSFLSPFGKGGGRL
jgi:hypothetical protein